MYFVELFILILSILVPLCFSGGWFMEEEQKPRVLDGSLRCYQCNSTEEVITKKELPVCTLNNWKHANITEKREMIMQCPRRKSAFCHLVIQEESGHTVRGCSGPRYTTNQTSHVGCFSMINQDVINRVCLCDTELCNVSSRLQLRLSWLSLLMPWVKIIDLK